MKFQKYTIISNIDSDDSFVIDVDLDTIDDDEPRIVLMSDTLDIIVKEDGQAILSENAWKFTQAYENDDLIKQVMWDIHDKGDGYEHDRGEYKIIVGDAFE